MHSAHAHAGEFVKESEVWPCFHPYQAPGGLSGQANSKKPAQAARDGGEGGPPGSGGHGSGVRGGRRAFVAVRAAAHTRRADRGELGRTGVNCNPNCNPES